MNKIIKYSVLGFSIIAGISLLLFSFSCPLLKPLTQPTGPFSVGKHSYHLVDKNHTDTRQPTGFRELMVQIYYPSTTKPQAALRHPYQPEKIEALKKIKSQTSRIPSFFWNQLLTGMTSWAEPQASISAEKAPYPLILFLPGIGSLNLYSAMLEELASHGYVIAEIEPPFDIELVVYPDKHVAQLDPLLSKAMASIDRTTIYAYRAEAHARWLAYITFVYDQLKVLNENPTSPFYKKLNLTQVGVLGHSHGGGVATDFCAKNEICTAGINIDGWTKTANTTQGFKKPFLFLMNEKGLDEVSQLAANMPDYAQKIEIPGAGHGLTSDLAYLKQPFLWFLNGTERDLTIISLANQYIISFFDKHLKKL